MKNTLVDGHKHEYLWATTKLGGFVHCELCGVINTGLNEKDCKGYIDPEILERERKIKRKEEARVKKEATIAYMKLKGLPIKV